MRSKTGFTLTEIMVVMVILSSLVLAVPPVITWLNQQGVRHAAQHLYGELQLARLAAIRSKKPCAISFDDPGPRQYSNSRTRQTVDLARYRGDVRFLPVGPDGKSMAPEISFNRQGMSTSVVPRHVYLSNARGTAIYRIRVMLPGGLSLARWNGKSW